VAPSRRRATGLAALLTVAVCLLTAASAFGADQRVVKIRDDCDPVTFNAAGVPCIGDGRTPIGDLVAAAQANDPLAQWRFSRPEFNIDAGGTIDVVNQGGEAHTFTKVAAFGDGCIPVVNPGGRVGTPAAPCDTIAPIPPGQTVQVTDLKPGINLFQCMIHPWMHSVVDVRDD
jgi:plastocyanin